MRLITLTKTNDDPIAFNPEFVETVEFLNSTKTRIHMTEDSFTVKEPFNDVIEVLADDLG